MVTIYALLDPNTEQIRYVGKTVHCPKRRLQNHLHEKGNTYKCNWIKSLNGKIPELLILDIVSKNDWVFWEQYWISQCKTWGFKLTNATLGGEGHCGYKPSLESTLKRSKSLTGSKRTIEQRDKMSKSRIGMIFTNEHKTNLSLSHRGLSPSRLAIETSAIRRLRKIIQLDENLTIIKEWDSIKEASIFYKVNQSSISHCCAGRKARCKGFIWKYETDYNK